MYEEAIRLLDEYAEALLAKNPEEFPGEYVGELRERLEQAEYLLAEVRAAEAEAVAAMSRSQAAFRAYVESTALDIIGSQPAPGETRATKAEMAQWKAAEMRIRTFTESFYYFSFRAYQIMRKGYVPGLRKFSAPGVLGVRNHLIEHPEQKKGVTHASWGWDGPNGPHVKPVKRSDDASDRFHDQGLYRNAEVFVQELERRLRNAIAST